MDQHAYSLAPEQRLLLQRAAAMGVDRPEALRARVWARVQGTFETSELAETANRVMNRHPVLGSALLTVKGLHVPIQRPGKVDPNIIYATAQTDGDLDTAIERLAEAIDHQNTALGAALGICRLSHEAHLVMMDAAALWVDAEGLGLLCNQFAKELMDPEDRSETLPFEEVVNWLEGVSKSEAATEGEAFWYQARSGRSFAELAGERLPLETNGARQAPQPAIGLTSIQLTTGMSQELDHLADRMGATVASVVCAVWGLVSGRMARDTKPVLGLANSLRKIEGIEDVIGRCRTCLPMSVPLDEMTTLRDLVGSVEASMQAADVWQPAFRWHGDAGDAPEVAPIFPFVLEDARGLSRDLGCARVVKAQDQSDVCGLRLRLTGTPETGFTLSIDADPKRFEAPLTEAVGRHVLRCLKTFTQDPETTLGEASPCPRQDAKKDGTFVAAPPVQMGQKAFAAAFSDQAGKTPDRIAVSTSEGKLSYRDLDAWSDAIAHRLVELGAEKDVPIGLCLPRGAEAIAAMLGIMKSGGCSVPMSPAIPKERIARILDNCGARTVVTLGAHAELFEGSGASIVHLDAINRADGIGMDRFDRVASGSLAYIMHTSGSTGVPKGVAVTHRALLTLSHALTDLLQDLRPNRPSKVALNAPLEFDASMQQICFLLSGDELCILDETVRKNPPAMVQWLSDQAIDILDATPTHIRSLLDAGLDKHGALRPSVLLVAGEAVDDVLWQRLAGMRDVVAFNIYGPTEATVDATSVRITADERPTIGRPLAGYGLSLRDPTGHLVPAGVPGEIYLSGAAVARGYHGNPEETSRAFPPDPDVPDGEARAFRTGDLATGLGDGRLVFLGRIDEQIKLHGVRIDPRDIEAALSRHPDIAACAVTAQQSEAGATMLVAHVQTRDAAVVEPAGLRQFLAGILPQSMIPARYEMHAGLPLTKSGKIDRSALARIGSEQKIGAGGAPKSDMQHVVSQVWQTLLGKTGMGIDDNFFALGGHSLLLVQVQHHLSQKLQRQVPLADLIEHGTIRELASWLTENTPQSRTASAGTSRAQKRKRLVRTRHGTAQKHPSGEV